MVKVVMTADNFALYFSRSMIPFLRAGGAEMETYRHWGIYAYRRSSLARFVSLPEGNLEKCEKLEQLRAHIGEELVCVRVRQAPCPSVRLPKNS